MSDYKIIIIPFSNQYNGIIFKTKLENSKQYTIEIIRKFTESENKLFEKEFNYTFDNNHNLKKLLNSIIKEIKLKSIKYDLYSEELIPFMIPNNEVCKFENF